ncbi:MAG: ABC transporter permease subunit [Candidatus Kariarchaeaceae archaeon]|jgi:ABC-type Na+ efflux pump permease subunit
MTKKKPITALIIQELRSASRSKYIIFSFILLPIFMWGTQILVVYSITNVFDSSQNEGQTIYYVNWDKGGMLNNESVDMGQVVYDKIIEETKDSESLIFRAEIETKIYDHQNLTKLVETLREEWTTPMIVIPANFTEVFLGLNFSQADVMPPEVYVFTLPNDRFFGFSVEVAISDVIYSPPFTIYEYEKETVVERSVLTFEGEEEAGSDFDPAGFIGFLSILIGVMAPASFITSSFSGEREKRTLEALLALPMSRFNILLGKILAGLVLIGIFTIMNIFGLVGYSLVTQSIADSDDAVLAISISLSVILAVGFMMSLSAFASIGIGISISSLIRDKRTAETTYMMTMLIPAMLVGMTSLSGGVPDHFSLMYLIPWTHSIAILTKSLYPKTYAASSLTGSINLDLMLHVSYLLGFVLLTIFIASKIFDREGIIE